MPVDLTSHVPIYEQIMDHIRGAVAAGVHGPGEPLPSIRALSLELLVNPNTVQRAYRELEREGLVTKRKGLGVFVAANGDTSAQGAAEKIVQGRFAEVIRTARRAGLSAEQIRGVFERSLAATGVGDAVAERPREGQ